MRNAVILERIWCRRRYRESIGGLGSKVRKHHISDKLNKPPCQCIARLFEVMLGEVKNSVFKEAYLVTYDICHMLC